MKKYIFFAMAVYLFVVTSVVHTGGRNILQIIACDVGQGDAILVMYQNTQLLVDGGPNDKVLTCLQKHMPFWDKEIEVVVNTHPEADHATGLIDVLEYYQVDHFIKNNDAPSTLVYRLLEDTLKAKGVEVSVNPSQIKIGKGMIQIDVVKNDQSQSTVQNPKLNLNSLVLLLHFQNFEALLAADIEPPRSALVAEDLARLGVNGQVEYIKVPHHGSKNGLTEKLLEITNPKVAVISVGKNQWGHPNLKTLDLLEKYNVEVKRTDLEGDVVVTTDGASWKSL